MLVSSAFAAIVPGRATLAASSGAAIYSEKCASCHKADGKGSGAFPALAANADVTAKTPATIVAVVEHGKGLMPAYKSQLSNAEAAAVLTYIRSAWGNKAAAVTAVQVAGAH